MADNIKVGDDHRADTALLLPPPSTSVWNFYPNFSSFTHTPFYCEENVYLLVKKLCVLGLADPTALDLFVVFISNDYKKVPLWNQKASKSSDLLVIWDYHVICIQAGNQKIVEEGHASHLIWDLDSSLPFPLAFDQYVSETFRQQLPLKSSYKRILRVIHAPIFLRHFASNRTHMRDSRGDWIAPPPNYEPIIAQDGSENNLDEYLRIHAADVMTDINALIDGLYSKKYGVLVHEAMLETLFSIIH